MENLTVSKEFIIDLHANPTKEKIEKEFPQLFVKKLEVGKWYKYFFDGNDYLINYQGDGFGYGFLNGVFSSNWSFLEHGINQCAELATKEEVETALIKEAKKRGFVKGAKFIDFAGYERISDYDARFFYDYKGKRGITLDCGQGKGLIFSYGKWATIIEQPTEITVAEIEAKLGYSIKIVK